ncbi:MAG: hypothetical protein QOH03_4050, partial [Kribbellaceae bacterium]|nr:hypothetical protein [Kribbellaceae bacterium]
ALSLGGGYPPNWYRPVLEHREFAAGGGNLR